MIGRKRARNVEQESRGKDSFEGDAGFDFGRCCSCVCASRSALHSLRHGLTQRPLVALTQSNAVAVQPFQQR